jgi:DNA-binding Lrp family transcriptional regulator
VELVDAGAGDLVGERRSGHDRRVRATLPEVPHPSSGSLPAHRAPRRVDDPVAATLLLDDVARSVLAAFLEGERGVREAADTLGLDLDATLYRVKRLERAGLLVQVGLRRRAGRPVRLYRAAAEAWFVPFEVLPHADLEEAFFEMHVDQGRRLARAAARALRQTSWAGYRIARGDGGGLSVQGVREDGRAFADPDSYAGPVDASVELHLRPADALRLNQELRALVERYLALQEGRGEPNRLLVVACVPLDDEG